MADATIGLKFEVDFGDSIRKFNDLKEASTEVRSNIENIGKTTKDVLPGMSDYITDSLERVNASEKSIRKIEKSYYNNSYSSTYDRDNALKDRDNSFANMSAVLADVKQMQQISTELGKSKKAMSAVTKTLPELFQIARDAVDVFKKTDQLPTDQQIRASMKVDNRFKNIQSSWGKGITEALTEQVLQYAVLKAVPQMQRGSFLSHFTSDAGTNKHIFNSFQDMLPKAFQNVNRHKGFINPRHLSKLKNEGLDTFLTQEELTNFYDLVRNNAYAANAAEAAQLIMRKNGKLGVRNGITRGMVNAMGGYMYDELVNSAKGMRMYGVTNVNDPDSWDRIARKGNKRFLGGMEAARRMSEQYAWFDADRYTQEEQERAFRLGRAKAGEPNKNVFYEAGGIKFSPLLNSYEVARYTLDDLKNNKNWNNPRTWGKNKTADDFHHFAIDESLHLDTIMKASKKGIRPHNSYLDDVIYLEEDDRLKDPQLDPKIRQQLIEEYANVIQHGISGKGKNDAGERYVFSRIHPGTGIEFIRKSQYDKLMKEDPTFLSAGLNQDTFDTWQDFAKAMEYRNKNATPGQDIRKLFGSDMPMKIAVVDLEGTTKGDKKNPGAGVNGASIISNRFVQTGFQGRMHGIKSALTSANIEALVDEYGDNLALTMYTGKKDEKGQRIKIGRDVDMIINASDLKNADARFAGMSNAEITKIVQQDIAKYGIRANRTYEDANGKTRWFSGQLAQILSMDTAASQMFTDAFIKHYRDVGTYEGARDFVFGKNDEQRNLLIKHPELFGTAKIQNQIADYRKSMMARMMKGDLMVPDELSAFKGMAAPWWIDAFNLDMKHTTGRKKSYWDQYIAGTDIEQRLNDVTLGNNRVLFQQSLASKLGLARYPATGRSMQSAENAALDPKIAEFAKKIGLDPKGLYVSTSSPLMTLLQSADFDGDVLEIIELATNATKGATVQDVFNKVVEATIKRNEDLYARGELSEEDAKRRNQQLKDTVQKNRRYSTKSGKDIALWMSEAAQQPALMGAPNATVRNAYQMQMNADIIRAVRDADEQYDANSVRAKKGFGRKTSQEQMALLAKYKPFAEFYNMVDKSRNENGEIDPAKLREKNFFAVNLPSANMSGSMRSQLLSRMIAKNKWGIDINKDYDWDKIFSIAHDDIDADTSLGKMQLALLDVYKGMLNADYIAPSNETVANLIKLKNQALADEERKVAEDVNAGKYAGRGRINYAKEAAKRLATQGGNVIDNLVEYALTQDKMYTGENGKMFGVLRAMGINNIIGNPDLSKYFSDTPFDVGKYRQEQQANQTIARSEAIKRISIFDEAQRTNAINNLSFSPSMLMRLAKDPLAWAQNYLANDWSTKEEPNFGMKLGTATHEAIEHYMRIRMNNKNQPLGEEGTKKAIDDTITRFNDALFNGYNDDVSGKRVEGLLNKTERKQIGKGTYNVNYQRLMTYYKNTLSKLFPEDEYEVVGIEGLLQPDYGNQIGKDEKIKASQHSAFDLLYKNKKTGNYTMADIKTLSSPMNAQEQALYEMQQLIYASAMQDYIKNVLGDEKGVLERAGYIQPLQGTFKEIDVSPDKVSTGMEKVRFAVSMIQDLAKTGFDDNTFIGLAQQLNTIFGSDQFNKIVDNYKEAAKVEATQNAHIQEQLSQNNGTGVAGALIMHDKYNQAIQKLEGIDKFIYAQERSVYPGDGMSFNSWQSQYSQLAMQRGQVAQLRNNGMNIEADDLEHRIESSTQRLDALLPDAAVHNLQEALDLIKSINKEEISTKGANARVEQYAQMKDEIESASDAYTVLLDKIDQNNKKIRETKAAYRGERDNTKRDDLKNNVDELQEKNKQYRQQVRQANDLQKQLADQSEIYRQKTESDVWKELNDSKNAFHDMATGKKPVSGTSILEDVTAYQNAISQKIADAKLYAKNGILDKSSPEFIKYLASLNGYRTGAKTTYMPHLIDSSLDSFMSERSNIAGNITGMQLTDEEKIDDIVRAKTLQIEEEKRKIAKRFKGAKLSDEQKLRLQELNDYYNKYDETEYRKQLSKSMKMQREMNLNRQSRQTDQMISQLDRIKMGRAGYYSNSIAGRAARQVQQELWQRRSMQDQYQTQLEQWKIEQKKYTDGNGNVTNQEQYDNAAQHIGKLNAAIEQNKAAMASLNGVGGTTAAVFGQIGQAVDGLLMRLGRQMFQKAMAETKRFIQEFDSSMNEIQAITLKSDTQMQPIRNQTIQKAIGMRTSVSNVANTEAALYRQGLSDQEVSSRTDAIIKFATVTKLNVTEATKIITTALQNDLVASAEQAMDALVALGDSAATTAAEIGKGMQKAAASAKVAGVSYAELTSLLTLGTSDTQLSGTQVGTALQTVFTRMRRISMSGFASDQNGDKTTASDAEAALQTIGVDLYSDKGQGRMRGAYEILRDIAKVWEHLSDVQKSLVTNAMAGTRQTNIFSTLMEGMSENGGERMDEYLGLADGSQGITQSKYEIAMKSLSASMDEFKSSFDSMVESLVSNGTITGVIDGLSGIFQQISGIASTDSGRIGVVFSAIAAGITAIGVAAATAKFGLGPISTILGLIAGLAVGGGLMGITSLFSMPSQAEKAAAQREKDYQDVQDKKEVRDSAQTVRQDAIDNVRKLGKAYDELKDSQDNLAKSDAASKLTTGLYELKDAFPELSKEILGAIQTLSNWEKAVDSADEKGKEYLKKNAEQHIADVYENQMKNAQAEYEATLNSQTFTQERISGLKESLDVGLRDAASAGQFTGDIFAEYAKGNVHTPWYNNAKKALNDARIKANGFGINKIERTLKGYNDYASAVESYHKNNDEKTVTDNDISALDTEIADLNSQLENANKNLDNAKSKLTFDETSEGKSYKDKITQAKSNLDNAETIKLRSNGYVTDEMLKEALAGAESEYEEAKAHWEKVNSGRDEEYEKAKTAVETIKTQLTEKILQRDKLAKQSASLGEIASGYESIMAGYPEEDQKDAIVAAGLKSNYVNAINEFDNAKEDENERIKDFLVGSYANNGEFKDFVDSRFSTNETALSLRAGHDVDSAASAELMKEIAGMLSDKGVVEQFQGEMEQINKSFAEDQIKEYINGFTTKQYGEEFMTTLLENMFKSEAYDEKGNFKDTFTDGEGHLKTEKVADWVLDKFNKYRGAKDPTAALVQANKKHAKYPYYYNGEGFMDYESARDWIITHGGSMTDLTDKAGNKLYQSAGSNINALIQKANESNANIMLQNFLNGKEYKFKDANGKEEKVKIGGLDSYKTIQGLEDAYDKYGLNGEISTLLAQNPTMLGLYSMAKNAKPEDQTAAYQRFKEAAKKMKVGQVSGSAIYDAVMEGLQTGSLNVTNLRTDGTYTDVYAAFKNFAGEAADEYLNALESGTMDGMDENIKKAVDRNVAANRIKEKMQFIPGYGTFSQNALTEMYGTDTERFSLRKQQVSSAADLDSYNAAVQRYRDHNAKEADFAIIAGRSMYSEAQLRNQYKSKAMDADLQREVDMYYADKVAEANNTIEAMRNGDADKDTIAASISNYMRQGYSFDIKTGRFTGYKPRSEEKETFASRRDSYNRQADESNLAPLWNALSDNMDWSDTGITSRLNERGYTDQDKINKLLEDSTFRNALNLGLGENSTYMQNLAKRRSTGKAGTFDENYGEWMKLIFGNDYNNKDTGITSGKFVISQNMKDKYNELVQNNEAALDELFSAMAGGDIFREILAGGEGDLNSAIQQYTDQKYADRFKNVKNGQQLAQDVTTFKTGTATAQAQTAEQYMNTVRAQQQAQWAIDAISTDSANNTAENRSMIASLLGLGDADVKDMIDKGKTGTDEIKNRIKDRVKETQDDLLKMFNGFFDDLDMNNTDWDEIKTRVNGMDAGPLKDMFDAIFAAYDLAGQVGTNGDVNGRNVKNLGDLFDQAKTGFADRAQAYKGYTNLHKALSKGEGNAFDDWLNEDPKDRQSFEELLNGIDKDFDWSSFMSKNSGAALILKMLSDGKMTSANADLALTYSQFNGQQTSAYTDTMLTTLFGGGFGKDLFNNGEIDTSKLSDLSTLLETIQGDEAGAAALDELTSRFESLQNAINALNLGNLKDAEKYLQEFNEQIKKNRADDYAKYGDYAEDVANAMDLFSKNTKKAAAAQKSFNQTLSQVSKNQYARNQWKKGKRDKDTISQIAQMTGMSEEDIKKKSNKGIVDRLLKQSEEQDKKSIEAWANGMSEDLSQALNEKVKDGALTLDDGFRVDVNGGSVNVDFSDVDSKLGSVITKEQRDIIQQLQAAGVKAHFEITGEGDNITAKIVIDSMGSGTKSSGGGGGGGGGKKSKADKLLEKQKQSTSINDHEIKMVQAQEDYYEGRSELGYYGETLQAEQTIRRRYGRRLEKQNKELHNQLKHTKRGTEEWYKLRDAIMANEEAQKENTNAIDENTRKIKENQSAIRQLRMDLEDTVRTEIETRIQQKRDMLEGRASMEQTILGIIQERYRKEWDLIKRDIDKKKEALEEEKKLIDERLQARKDAADKASKFEELAELQNQLAMISMDSTRTKDAADLRKRIADLQGDIAWGTAEDEANNQKEALDDRIQAYDEFEQRGDEALEKYLEDANNFAGEVNKVLKMSQKDLIKWLEKNDDEYKNSLNNTKKSIVEGWTDLYKQMKGITDTYWKEINKVLGSKKSYINYMKDSSEYKNASKTEREEMVYQWGLQYDNYTAALKTGSKYSHSDDWANDEGKKDDKKGGSGSGGGGDLAESRAENNGKPLHGYKVTYERVYSNGKKDKNGNYEITGTENRKKVFSLKENPGKSWKEVKEMANNYKKQLLKNAIKGTKWNRNITVSAYEKGGLVDYTGPAWVDGTPTKPEAFLSAIDTKNIRDLLDAFNYIKSPRMTYYDMMKNMGNTNNSIGEVSVTINGATFEDDADYEKIAQRVGEEFAKELQRQGFSTARYNF